MKAMRLTGLLTLAAILITAPPGISAVDQAPVANPDKLLADIKARAESLQTFVARFKQTRNANLLREPLVSEGLIYFKRDGKMLTHVSRPSELMLLFDDRYVTIVNPKLKTVFKGRLPRSDRMIKAWFQWDVSIETLKQQYTWQVTESPNGKHYTLHMTPVDRQMARHLDSLAIEVGAETLLPEKIVITTAKGDRTTVQLQIISTNEPLPKGIFDIVLPETFPSDR